MTAESAEPVRRRILVVSDMSGRRPGGGGMTVLNQRLTEALALHHDVTLLTVGPADPHGRARVVELPALPGIPARASLFNGIRTHRPEDFGLEGPMDIVVGHSRFSGFSALEAVRRWYGGRARLAHFLHTTPERYAEIKGVPRQGQRHAQMERGVLRAAHIAVGIGEILTEEAARLMAAHPAAQRPHLHEAVPGADLAAPGRRPTPGMTLGLLLSGRAGDTLKGARVVAAAVRMLRDDGLDVRLRLLGAPAGEVDELQRELEAVGGGPPAITVLPFSTDDNVLRNELLAADAVVMPSEHEAFGMAPLDGLGVATPVLVNEDSGIARLLRDTRRMPEGVGDLFVVPDLGLGEERPQAWAQGVLRLFRRLPEFREAAGRTQHRLAAFTWEHMGQAFVAAAMAAPPRWSTAPGEARRHTVQGPHGTLLAGRAADGAGAVPERAAGPDFPGSVADAVRRGHSAVRHPRSAGLRGRPVNKPPRQA